MKTKNKRHEFDNLLNELDQYRAKDFTFSSGHILGSMCTQSHPLAKEAYIKFLDTNLGDPELFPGTKKIETEFIISALLHAPKNAAGQIVSGGTEGNITAMWVARQLTGKKEIIIPESAHFSFKKIASLMDMHLIPIKLTSDCIMDVSNVKNKINNKTAAVVGIAGSTELGAIDPLPELSDICSDEQVFFHVDAAFGGFVIPFLKELGHEVPDFDFQLKGVSSVSIDSHKMGHAAIPLGTLMIREKTWLDEISVKSHCVSGKRQAGLLGTRSGGPIAAAYAVTKYLGVKGYKELVERCMDNTCYAEKCIQEIGLDLAIKPTMNILGVKIKNPFKVTRALTKYGWKVNIMDRISCIRLVLMPRIRLVLMPHVSKSTIDEFIPDLKKACFEVGEL